jgi:hypothetical protein
MYTNMPSFEFQQTAQHCIREDRTLHNHRSETHKATSSSETFADLQRTTRLCNNYVLKYLDEFYASRSRDNAVGIATGYGLDGRGVGVRVPVGGRFLSPPQRPDQLWSPPSLLSSGYRRLFPRGKAAGARSLSLTPPTSAEVNNTWIFTPTSPYAFTA